MALSPLSNRAEQAEETAESQPSKTYRLDFDKTELGGFIDDKEALKQFVRKAVITARFRYEIYSDDYGCELIDLIGDDLPYELLEMEIPRIIKEAIVYDDRVADAINFKISRLNDGLYIEFKVIPTEGESFTQEVTL